MPWRIITWIKDSIKSNKSPVTAVIGDLLLFLLLQQHVQKQALFYNVSVISMKNMIHKKIFLEYLNNLMEVDLSDVSILPKSIQCRAGQ